MHEDRNAVASPERMFAVGKNFDVAEGAREQSLQARAGEEILVVALEQMPGNDAPVVQIREQFQVGN